MKSNRSVLPPTYRLLHQPEQRSRLILETLVTSVVMLCSATAVWQSAQQVFTLPTEKIAIATAARSIQSASAKLICCNSPAEVAEQKSPRAIGAATPLPSKIAARS